ncbi:MAG TPA: glycosyltransferase family 9 protein [Candidatus Binatia bacterium]|nr:glycosyltransferase family 9 protein [Candidatus Binatia bacterium]
MTLSPVRILIVLHGSIGDVTRALPVASLLRHGFPGAHIAWSIEPAALPLVEMHPAVDEVILFDRRSWRQSLLPFLSRIRGGRFNIVLDLQRHLKSGLISRWSGAQRRIGFHRSDAKELNWLFNNQHIPPSPNDSKLNDYLSFLDCLFISKAPLEWAIPLAPSESERVETIARDIGTPFATYCVGASWQSKRWVPAEAARTAETVRQRHGLAAVILGGEEDRGFATEMERLAATAVVNLTGRTSLRESVGILARAEISVGPDSGLMHLSAAVGTPVVSLWGPTDPKRTGPYGFEDLIVQGRAPCAPCYARSCPIGRVCMEAIKSDDVLSKIDAALARKEPLHG